MEKNYILNEKVLKVLLKSSFLDPRFKALEFIEESSR